MKNFLVAAAALALLSAESQAQFTAGNLAVLRAGNGSETLVNTGNSLFVDQYTPAGVLVNTAVIPNTWPNGLIISGVAASEGSLTRSLDRTTLVFAGYNTNRASVTGSLANSTGSAVARGYATIDSTETYALQQARSDIFSANNPRGACGDGTNNFWLAGGTSGTLYLKPPSAPPVTVQSAIANTRYVKAVNGVLYFTTQSGTAGLYSLGALPAAAATATEFIVTGASSSPCQFDMNLAGNLVYITDQRAIGSGGGIQKWNNAGSGWTNVYTLTNNLGAAGPFGLAVDFSGAAPIIYATSGDASTNRLVSLVDTNANAVGTIIARAATGEVFRGLDFVPDLRPLIIAQPQSETVASGTDVALSVGATSVLAVNYQWQKNGVNVANATTSTLSLHSVSSADTAPYRVIVSNTQGSVTSVIATLTVNTVAVPPRFTSEPLNQTNFAGGDVTFTAGVSGTDPLTYQWQFNDADLLGETNITLALTDLVLAQTGNYRILVSNSAGSTNSQEAYLFVQAIPPTMTVEPASQIVLSGTTVVFHAAASGTAPFTYQWVFNNGDISDGGDFTGTTTDTLTVTGTRLADGGIYYVKITNPGGTTNSAPALLTVISNVPPSYVAYGSAGTVYMQNFDSLPNPGSAGVNADNTVTIGPTTYGLNDPFDFAFPVVSIAKLGGLGLSNTMAGWYGLGVSGSKLGASPGDQSTGGIISFGLTNSANANRALGLLATSSTGPTAFGAKFINTSGDTLARITVHFTGELWRQQPTAKTLSFGYLIEPTATAAFSTNVTEWLSSLDVTFTTNALSPVDGTASANQISLGATNQVINNWPPGAALWLVWQMTNAASNGQGLAIDDLTFSAAASPAVSLSIQLSDSHVTLSWPTAAGTFQLQQTGDLTQAGGWADVPNTVIIMGAFNTVSIPVGSQPQYFRLRQ